MTFSSRLLVPTTFLVLAMSLLFGALIKHQTISRWQENTYLGRPYVQMVNNNVEIVANDPYVENAPSLLLVPAWILKVSQNMLYVRMFMFLFSLAGFVLIYRFALSSCRSNFAASAWGVWAVAFLCMNLWYGIPEIMSYPLAV